MYIFRMTFAKLKDVRILVTLYWWVLVFHIVSKLSSKITLDTNHAYYLSLIKKKRLIR